MKNARKLAGFIAGTSALSLLLATSAFAEDRHRDETWKGKDREQSRSAQRDESRNSNRTYNGGEHRDANTDNNVSRESNDNRRNTSSRENTYNRNNNDYRANRDYRSNGNYSRHESNNNNYRAPRVREEYRNGVARSDGRITFRGRVNRYERYNGGYRVWFAGGLYPYWVPESYFRSHRISVGLDIRLGGIFRNGGVYVDVLGYPGDPYYNDPYYNEGGYYGSYDDGYVRGIIDRVDLRSETLFVRDDNSRGGYVTVDMRSIDWRGSRLDIRDLRPGDRVSLSGSWVRGGLFNAYRIDSIGAY